MSDKFTKIRLGATLLLTAVIGVLSSIFAAQIMPNGNLNWSLAFHVPSFWLLLFTVVVLIVIQVWFFKTDNEILKFADNEYCRARARALAFDLRQKFYKRNPGALLDLGEFLKDMGLDK